MKVSAQKQPHNNNPRAYNESSGASEPPPPTTSRTRDASIIVYELWVPSEASKGGLRNEKKGGDQRQTVLELDYVRIT